jgi:hypothetical protein
LAGVIAAAHVATFSANSPARQPPNFHHCLRNRRDVVPESVLDAIRLGIWDYEPEAQRADRFDATKALPGTDQKLAVLAERLAHGLPLWHDGDRRTYDESEGD